MKNFEDVYPSLSQFALKHGDIHLGLDQYNMSLVTVGTEDDVIWHSTAQHGTLNLALEAAERVVKEWLVRKKTKSQEAEKSRGREVRRS